MKMLGIKTIVTLTPKKMEELEKDFNLIHFEVLNYEKDLESLLDMTEIV